MKTTVNVDEFIQAFAAYRRENPPFTRLALFALYDYLNETDPGYHLDVTGLCEDYTEYSSFAAWQADYFGIDDEPTIYDLNGLRSFTTVIPFGGGIIVENL